MFLEIITKGKEKEEKKERERKGEKSIIDFDRFEVLYPYLYFSPNFAHTNAFVFSSFPQIERIRWKIEVCALLVPINGEFDSTFSRDPSSYPIHSWSLSPHLSERKSIEPNRREAAPRHAILSPIYPIPSSRYSLLSRLSSASSLNKVANLIISS